MESIYDRNTRPTDDPLNESSSAADQADTGAMQGKAQGAIDTVKEKATQVSATVGDIKDKASEVSTQTAQRVDEAMTTTGQRMTTLAQTVRDNAPEGRTGSLAATAASRLEQGGEYLQRANANTVMEDLGDYVRRNPLQSMGIAVGVGYLLAHRNAWKGLLVGIGAGYAASRLSGSAREK